MSVPDHCLSFYFGAILFHAKYMALATDAITSGFGAVLLAAKESLIFSSHNYCTCTTFLSIGSVSYLLTSGLCNWTIKNVCSFI